MPQKNKNPKPNVSNSENLAERNTPSTSGFQNVKPTKEDAPTSEIQNVNLSPEDDESNVSMNEMNPFGSRSFRKKFKNCIEAFHKIEKNGKKERKVRSMQVMYVFAKYR